MTTYPHPHRAHLHRPRVNLWLVAVVGLAAALIGLASWVVVDRYAGGSNATQEATTLFDRMDAAWSTGDTNAIATLYTSDAIVFGLEDKFSGPKAIAQAVAHLHPEGFLVRRVAPVTVSGDFAATWGLLQFSAVNLRNMPVITVFQLKDGKIFRQWGYGMGMSPPFDAATTP